MGLKGVLQGGVTQGCHTGVVQGGVTPRLDVVEGALVVRVRRALALQLEHDHAAVVPRGQQIHLRVRRVAGSGSGSTSSYQHFISSTPSTRKHLLSYK